MSFTMLMFGNVIVIIPNVIIIPTMGGITRFAISCIAGNCLKYIRVMGTVKINALMETANPFPIIPNDFII